MVGSTLRTKTPGDVAVPAREIQGFLAFRAVAIAAGAKRFTAAIVVRNQVVPVIDRVVAGANPVNGRGLTARRTAALGTAAATAKRAANGAIPPVIATFRVAQLNRCIGTECAYDRQQRRRTHTDDACAEPAQEAAP